MFRVRLVGSFCTGCTARIKGELWRFMTHRSHAYFLELLVACNIDNLESKISAISCICACADTFTATTTDTLGESGMLDSESIQHKFAHVRRISTLPTLAHLRDSKHGRNGIDSEDDVAQLDAH